MSQQKHPVARQELPKSTSFGMAWKKCQCYYFLSRPFHASPLPPHIFTHRAEQQHLSTCQVDDRALQDYFCLWSISDDDDDDFNWFGGSRISQPLGIYNHIMHTHIPPYTHTIFIPCSFTPLTCSEGSALVLTCLALGKINMKIYIYRYIFIFIYVSLTKATP